MRERPILFSGPMVRAILDGRKTQTRRVIREDVILPNQYGRYVKRADGTVTFAPNYLTRRPVREKGCVIGHREPLVHCPYGDPGDLLWVRETWTPVEPSASGRVEYDGARVVEAPHGQVEVWYRADGELGIVSLIDEEGPRWRPSIHMPRWASRITLEVTGVRVERLQDIDGDDILAEGFRVEGAPIICGYRVHDPRKLRDGFAAGWDSINGKRPGAGWDANPWVWVVGFRRVEQEATDA